jgi:hypothetical protein
MNDDLMTLFSAAFGLILIWGMLYLVFSIF